MASNSNKVNKVVLSKVDVETKEFSTFGTVLFTALAAVGIYKGGQIAYHLYKGK